jgi:hypothetical protein
VLSIAPRLQDVLRYKLADSYRIPCNTKITDAGLPKLRPLVNLEFLHLGRTPATNAGIENLLGLKKLKRLEVTNTKVTDEGADKLRKALPDCEVLAGVTDAKS